MTRIYSQSHIIEDVKFSKLPKDKEVENKQSQSEALLDLIFAVDSRTGIPKGDIAQYLGKDTSDDIKKFIERNLMSDGKPNQPIEQLNKDYANLSDDFVFDMQRKVNENIDDYYSRLEKYLKDVKAKHQYEKLCRRNSK